ncbi:MAG: hypothetical protein R3175_09615 [Marinobacter sp.]|uniref:DUF6969 family protein n=1 Tax=Marinobacter sp. TaxID=50741 RepID=UPI00299DE6C5|nr:hypothetical protein [Marinobacter sp.]MDX1756303.1 hypothetical protein [Marinobacter sp.]
MAKLDMPELSALPQSTLRNSLAAADEIRECYRVLKKGGLNVVGEVLRGQGPFYEMDHYPKDDVYDREFHAQYYYHAHRDDHDEHGHFHLFVRDGAIDPAWQPVLGPVGKDRVVHLVAIAMDAWGYPIELFEVNRWVTDESWMPAERVIPLLDRFTVDHANPSWPVNRWISAMVRCFRPQIEALLRQRDQVLLAPGADRLTDTLDERQLEITGSVPVDLDSWRHMVVEELQGREREPGAAALARAL